MRAWIQSSLFGVPLPERILPSVSRTSSVLALARPGLRRVGMKKVSVPGTRALACPNALERPKRSTMRLARATSRLSVGSAPRRLFALLMLRFVPQGEQGFGDERRALFASGELVDRSPGGKGALEPLHRADFPESPGVPRGCEPPLLLAVGLESRLLVQREYGGGRPVARGELFLLRAPEQGPSPVRALGREEKLELALLGGDPVPRHGPHPSPCVG